MREVARGGWEDEWRATAHLADAPVDVEADPAVRARAAAAGGRDRELVAEVAPGEHRVKVAVDRLHLLLGRLVAARGREVDDHEPGVVPHLRQVGRDLRLPQIAPARRHPLATAAAAAAARAGRRRRARSATAHRRRLPRHPRAVRPSQLQCARVERRAVVRHDGGSLAILPRVAADDHDAEAHQGAVELLDDGLKAGAGRTARCEGATQHACETRRLEVSFCRATTTAGVAACCTRTAQIVLKVEAVDECEELGLGVAIIDARAQEEGVCPLSHIALVVD